MAETAAAPNNRAIAFRGKAQRERPRMSGFGVSPQRDSAGSPNATDDTSGQMPWDSKSFRKHNKSLNPSEAKSAARQATAMVNSGVDEGIAIATANKRINKLRKRGVISTRMSGRHLEDKYGGKDQQGIDAASR